MVREGGKQNLLYGGKLPKNFSQAKIQSIQYIVNNKSNFLKELGRLKNTPRANI